MGSAVISRGRAGRILLLALVACALLSVPVASGLSPVASGFSRKPASSARIAGAALPSAQSEVSDSDLERVSKRMVKVGSLSNARPIATVPMEVYVSQVLSLEADPTAPDAAQQALAVAIRTYAIVEARHQRDGYDVCDTTHCQVFRAATEKTRRAALATAGRILTYNGAPAAVFYSASCGGRSESAADMWPGTNFPYLQSVEDDVHGDDAEWTLERTLSDVQRTLERSGIEGKRLTDLRVDARTGSGRVARVRLIGLDPEVITGDQFRMAMGPREIRSTAFSIEKDDDRLRFTGRGYGHGVGLCAVGSGKRAARGESFEQILAHYYPGLELTSLDGLSLPEPAGAAPVSSANVTPAAAARRSGRINVHVPRGSLTSADDLERMTQQAYTRLSARLSVSVAPISVQLHQSVDDFRTATGQPWWVSSVTRGSEIDLAPAAILAQRDGLEATLRRAVAELLVAGAFAERRAWVRIGAARYFARDEPLELRSSPRCPSDEELTRAVSAVAQREAEARAEMCFARALEDARDWRAVR